MKIRIDKDISTFALATLVFLAFVVGIFAGSQIIIGYKDAELANKQAALEAALASVAEANEEAAFWRQTMKMLAEGDQLKEIK